MTDWSFHTCVDNVEWDDFVSKSEQGIFTKSMILDVVGDTTTKYFLKKKAVLWQACQSSLRGEPLFPVPFCYYQGHYLDKSINCLNAVRNLIGLLTFLPKFSSFYSLNTKVLVFRYIIPYLTFEP